jgi:ankyrin repeat protein
MNKKFAVFTLLGTLVALHQAQGVQNKDLQSQFFDAVHQNKVGKLRDALEKGAAVNMPEDRYGTTALHHACLREGREGYEEIVQLLLDYKADPNMPDACALTPLYFACWNGNFKIAAVLISRGAKIDMRDKLGFTLLHNACRDGKLDIVMFLVEKGANINTEATYDHSTPLSCLCIRPERTYLSIAKFLVARGATIPRSDISDSGTPDGRAVQWLFWSVHHWKQVQESPNKENEDSDQEYFQMHLKYLHNAPTRMLPLLLRSKKLAKNLLNAIDNDDKQHGRKYQTLSRLYIRCFKDATEPIKPFTRHQMALVKDMLEKKLMQ